MQLRDARGNASPLSPPEIRTYVLTPLFFMTNALRSIALVGIALVGIALVGIALVGIALVGWLNVKATFHFPARPGPLTCHGM